MKKKEIDCNNYISLNEIVAKLFHDSQNNCYIVNIPYFNSTKPKQIEYFDLLYPMDDILNSQNTTPNDKMIEADDIEYFKMISEPAIAYNSTLKTKIYNGYFNTETNKIPIEFKAKCKKIFTENDFYYYFLLEKKSDSLLEKANIQLFHEFLNTLFDSKNEYYCPSGLKNHINGWLYTKEYSKILSHLLLLVLMGDYTDFFEYDFTNYINKKSTRNISNLINLERIFRVEDAQVFSSCGKESTIISKEIYNNALCVALNFEPTRIRSEIPDWSSLVFMGYPEDITKFEFLQFEIRSTDTSYNKIQLEIKPFEKKWMHFKKVIKLTDHWKIEKISLENVELRTRKIFEELCFVTKVEYLSDHMLRGSYEVRDIKLI
ncbi:hypothetical protein [Acetobacterium wieringae]|uniref:hypothetical protein n=1 Tax=Acetobacterium wieringae TaxID=52694 RepID=UPI0026F08D98|nr:hypothetical protein [Acetobacterium wieringae]